MGSHFSTLRTLFAAVLVAGCSFVTLEAQAPSQPPEGTSPEKLALPDTPEGRMKKFDLAEDPGLDPDPETIFIRNGKQYTIEKFEKRWAILDIGRPGWARPFGNVNVVSEVYRQDDESLWVWREKQVPQNVQGQRVDAAGQISAQEKLADETAEYYQGIRPEFEVLAPASIDRTLTFVESSNGLPTSGSWRNSLDVADMNGDGFLDIIAPPERGVGGPPAIFLGDGKGNWKYWEEAKFPSSYQYGSVVAADLNKNGRMDLVLGVHLYGVVVFLGDGKGNFTESNKGLPTDFPTRRAIVTDVNRDGLLDIVAISEGPMMSRGPEVDPNANASNLRVYLNQDRGKSWKETNIAERNFYVGGDWLSTGDFNGDRIPDFIGASVYFNGPDTLYVSNGPLKWDPVGRGKLIPFLSYYWASTVAKFTGKKTDDAIISYTRHWPSGLPETVISTPEHTTLAGLDLLTWTGKTPRRVPIARWPGAGPTWGLGHGDFDGDGHLDLVYSVLTPERELRILLGDGKGGFRSPVSVTGLVPMANYSYDLKVADVNGDGRPDVIILYESSETLATRGKDGAIQVFLNTTPRPGRAVRVSK